MPETDEAAASNLELEGFITFRLSKLQAKLNKQASTILKANSGLTLTQWRIMILIGNRALSKASEITREGAIDKGLFSRKVRSLVEAGLVASVTDKVDHRVQRLSLTPQGVSVYESTFPIMQERQRHLRSCLETHESDVLERALDKLFDAAEKTDFKR